MTSQQSNQSKLSSAKNKKSIVRITTKEGELIEGIPVYAESGAKGSPDWIIKEINGSGSTKKVNLNEIESIS